MNDDPPSFHSPTTIIAFAVLVIVAGTIVGVFLKGDSGMMNTISGLVIGSGMGGVCGYYFGSSRGSQMKDQMIADRK